MTIAQTSSRAPRYSAEVCPCSRFSTAPKVRALTPGHERRRTQIRPGPGPKVEWDPSAPDVHWMWVQIADRIKADVTSAMKAGERNRVTALRLVLSELQKAAKEGDADELAVLRRERKRRREAEEAYRNAGREDLADGEAFEAAAIETYLPSELSDEELDALVSAAIAETGASSPRDMGRVIKHVMGAAGGRADGKRVSTKVKEALN